jgi:hypothetical protein
MKASQLQKACVWISDAGFHILVSPISCILTDEGLPLLYDIESNTSEIWLGLSTLLDTGWVDLRESKTMAGCCSYTRNLSSIAQLGST